MVTEETMVTERTMVMERTVVTEGNSGEFGGNSGDGMTVQRAVAVGATAKMETAMMTMGMRSPNTVA